MLKKQKERKLCEIEKIFWQFLKNEQTIYQRKRGE
jgi:hypothetical protein